jgi:hypothetical protein
VIKRQHADAQKAGLVADTPVLRHEPQKLDLRVRVLFEENLNTLIFPKVKEFLFRVAKHSPLEVAAKVLASKNMHPQKWKDYSFSQYVDNKEIRYQDLGTSFDQTCGLEQTCDELILFYSVKDLEQYVPPSEDLEMS